MKPTFAAPALLALIAGTPAQAERWVAMDEGATFTIEVDADSLRRDDNGLIHFRERYYEGAEVTDKAVDCAKRASYTIRINTDPPIDYPDWLSKPHKVAPDSIGEAELDYVCARG